MGNILKSEKKPSHQKLIKDELSFFDNEDSYSNTPGNREVDNLVDDPETYEENKPANLNKVSQQVELHPI